jgi:hypothetical protein
LFTDVRLTFARHEPRIAALPTHESSHLGIWSFGHYETLNGPSSMAQSMTGDQIDQMTK